MTLVIGLTGSIATGKSTVSEMFRELNIPVVDADLIAREVVEKGKPAYNQVVKYFGKDILQSDGEFDRKKLGNIVFNDDKKREKLNSIVHPAIREEMIRQREAYKSSKVPCVVLDIPLLYESDLIDYVDKVIVSYVTEEIQLERLVKRDQSSVDEARSRINSQISIDKKKMLADAIIDNTGTRENSRQQLENLLKRWESL